MSLTREEKIESSIKTKARLRALTHEIKETKFMVKNAYGCIVGGNLMQFIPTDEQGKLCYPTCFDTKREAEYFINDTPVNDRIIELYIKKKVAKEIAEYKNQ